MAPTDGNRKDADEDEDVGLRQSSSGKWRGMVCNLLEKTAGGGPKKKYTPYVASKDQARRDRAALQSKIDTEYWASRAALARADSTLVGVECVPDDINDAVANRVYWSPNQHNDHIPYRVIRMSNGKQGFRWDRACDACPVDDGKSAIGDGKGGERTLCVPHGGGCAHHRVPSTCRECNPRITKMANKCNYCGTGLSNKRFESNGGNGLCPTCELHFKAEAAENGSAPPAKGKSWEDVCFEKLIPLITDADGDRIPIESRDDLSNMLGSNSKRNKGECSTEHQRRPDGLWLKRDLDGYIIAAVDVEVDEDSHFTREPACEAGKVDETFHSILQLAQNEGKGRLAKFRKGIIRPPFCCFLKMNPNACDAPGGKISLQTRIEVTAEITRRILQAPISIFHEMADNGITMFPYVQCLYYHTKRGAANLAYFDKHSPGAWSWQKNLCFRSVEEIPDVNDEEN